MQTALSLAIKWAPKAAHKGPAANAYQWLKQGTYRDVVDLLLASNLGNCAYFLGIEDVKDVYQSKLCDKRTSSKL
jgi:hypothetical protein